MFPCGVPLTTEAGADALKGPRNLDAVRAAIRESGYNGEKVGMLTPTDFATIHPMGLVSNDLLRRLGMNVELVQTDWGTVIQRRASREPVERGGWSIFHTWWPSVSILNPAVHAPLRGNGLQGWFGWATSERREQLIQEWLTAPTEDEQKRIAAEIQRDAFDNVPYIPVGQFLIRTAYRRNLTGMVKGSSPYPWNLRRT
jgi:peptide/nickel transport system substrate-binding protein